MSETTVSREDALQKLKALIEDSGVAMLTTQEPDGELTSRPMAVTRVEGDVIWFFTNRQSGKINSITKHHQVNLGFAAVTDSSFVSIAGRAELVNDKEKIHELWSKAVEAYLPEGPDSPQVGLIRVRIESAEYWDAPSSKSVRLIGMAKAILTGQAYRPGHNERVDLH